MSLRIKALILSLLIAAAVISAVGAFRSMRRGEEYVTAGIKECFSLGKDGALCYIRPFNGCVAVFSDRRARFPETVTGIELSSLRAQDANLVGRGIPVMDREELLELLEDLGS